MGGVHSRMSSGLSKHQLCMTEARTVRRPSTPSFQHSPVEEEPTHAKVAKAFSFGSTRAPSSLT